MPQEQKDAENVRDYINEKTSGLRKTLLLPLDLKSEANCIKAVQETVANFGRLDVLFNKYVRDAYFPTRFLFRATLLTFRS